MKIIVFCALVASCLAEMEVPVSAEELTRVAMDVAKEADDTMLKAEPKEVEPIQEESEKLRIYIVPHLQRARLPQRPPVAPFPLSRFNTPFIGAPYPRPYPQPMVVPASQNLFRTHFPQPSRDTTNEELVMEHPLARVVYLTTPTYSPHYVYDPLQGQVTESQFFIDKKSCLTTPLASFCLKKPVLNV